MKKTQSQQTANAAELFERGRRIITEQRPTGTNPPAAAPATEPHIDIYQGSLLAQCSRLISHASNEEQVFLKKLLQICNDGVYNLMEAAFVLGNREFGFSFLNEPDTNRDYAEDLRQLYRFLDDRDWLATFLSGVCYHARQKATSLKPDEVLFFLEERMNNFQTEVEAARQLLHDYPDVLRAEVRDAVEMHPDLIGHATA
jgi:hypothetical protein